MFLFRKSLAFRLLALSFILLALPLLVDSFVIFHKGYQDAIGDAKGKLIELARSREVPIEEIQPVKGPIFTVIEKELKLEEGFPQNENQNLNEKLHHMAEEGNLGEVTLLRFNADGQYVVIGSSDPSYMGRNFNALFQLADIYSPKNKRQGYFNALYHDPQNDKSYLIVGQVVYSPNDGAPLGIVMTLNSITKALSEILQPAHLGYMLNFALLFPETVVFASSNPLLNYHYFEPLSKEHRRILEGLDKDAKSSMPVRPFEISYAIGYPFFEFFWHGKAHIGYMRQVPDSNYMILTFASKERIYAAPFKAFSRVYLTFLGILVIGGLLAYLLTKRMAKPLRSLSKVMQNIQKGDLSSRYKYDPLGFEINLLGNIFNEMVDALILKKHTAEEARVKKELLSKELLIGQQVQRALLPVGGVEYPGVDIAATFIPAKNVGGDFYGAYVPEGKDHVVLSVADAAGKGVQACFYSIGARSMIRSFMTEYDDVAEALNEANTLFCKDTRDSGMFITVVLASYQDKTKTLHYFSCGHNPGLVFRNNGELEFLKNQEIALGIRPLQATKSEKVLLESGEYVIFYTDGITEAHNERFEEFGEARLLEYIKNSGRPKAQLLSDGIVQAVTSFAGSAPQHDDITILVMRVL